MRRGQLWGNRDFLRLWASESVSLIGSQVTTLALPLCAIVTLDASALEVTLLAAALWAPFLIVNLPAGVLVDRCRRRPLLMTANVGRGVLLAAIPAAHWAGVLSMGMLYVVAFLVGGLGVVFNVAYRSYLPSVVSRHQLLEGNSKLQASAAVAEVGGPGLGGLLVQAVTAPVAILADAVSFLVSAALLGTIRAEEPSPARPTGSLRGLIGEGMRLTFGNPTLRAMAGSAATFNLFEQVIRALFLVHATRTLGFDPAALGLILAAGNVGAVAGAVVAERFSVRVGFGRALVVAALLEGLGFVPIPLVTGGGLGVAAALAAGFGVVGFGGAASQIYWSSLRQAIVPEAILGRVQASYGVVTLGVVPLGALLAGAAQSVVGVRATLALGVVGLLASMPWVLVRDVRSLCRLPEQMAAAP